MFGSLIREWGDRSIVAKTLIDVDEDLLRQAQRILDTSTKKETVNGALREIVRREAAIRFLELARSGIFATSADPTRVGRLC